MSGTTYAIEDLLNMALRRIAYQTPIASIYEGSRAARIGVEIYAQTRDNLLRSKDWPFARVATGLTLLKTAPVGGYGVTPWTSAYPPLPWIYEYAYPDNCLEVRAVRPTPILIPEYDPQPNVFVVANDNTLGPAARVVLTNLANAQAVITGLVTDPNQWEANFVEALVDALALRFQTAMAPNPEMDKERAAETQMATAVADARRG